MKHAEEIRLLIKRKNRYFFATFLSGITGSMVVIVYFVKVLFTPPTKNFLDFITANPELNGATVLLVVLFFIFRYKYKETSAKITDRLDNA